MIGLSETAWHDSVGTAYGCDFYEGHNLCGTGDGLENFGRTADEACCACGGGAIPIKEVEGKTSKLLMVSIVTSLLLACILGASAWYYRTNYNKILYARPGDEHVHSATMGRKAVVSTPEDI